MKVLVAGSSGFVGSALCAALEERGDTVFRLVRSNKVGPNEIGWDPVAATMEIERLAGFDAVVHLGGVSIGETRWTHRQKEKLWNSRVVSTRLLSDAFNEIPGAPDTFICASATGFYGNRGDEVLDESASKGNGFLSDLCEKWEAATEPATQIGIRVANLRSGIVLGHGGGVLKQQVPLFRLCLGGVLGHGKQFMSWISLEDEVRAIIHVLDNPAVTGPVNLTAPNPERNYSFTKILGAVLNRPTVVPVPRWMMTMPLGQEFTDEVLMTSQRVLPSVLEKSGFEFHHQHLEDALHFALETESHQRASKTQDDKNEED